MLPFWEKKLFKITEFWVGRICNGYRDSARLPRVGRVQQGTEAIYRPNREN